MTRWLPFCCPRSDAEHDSYATREASLPHFRSDRAGTITIVSSGALMRVESVPHGLELSLEAAIRANDVPAATELVRSGVDVNRLTSEGLTPLMLAAGQGQAHMLELLLSAGAQVLAIEPRAGATALHKAALSGNPDVVGLLLDHGGGLTPG